MTTKKKPVVRKAAEPQALAKRMTEAEWLKIDGSSMCPSKRLGIEITVRVVLDAQNWQGMEEVEEILEKAREYVAAEISNVVEIVG